MLIVMAAPSVRKLVLGGRRIGSMWSAGLVVLGAVSAPLTPLWLLQRRLI
jgi:hypothetical protein